VRPIRTALVLLARVALAAGLAAASLSALGPGASAADPIQDADATVQTLRRDADHAAQAYFDALARMQTLDAQAAEIEARLPALEAERRALRVAVRARAAEAYKRAGASQLASIIGSHDALEAARRTQWLERLNTRDDESFSALQDATEQLEQQRAQLRDAQQAQQQALAQLEATGQEIQAKLQAAEDRRRALAAQAAAAVPRPVAPKGSGGAPPGPPPDYVPTPGTHPMHDDPFLVCTRNRESGGNYAAYNPAGPYMGAYQLLQSTWNSTANHAGRPELIGVPPNTASQYDQDDMAWSLYQWRGSGPWGGRCG